ncbi:MAG TPA: NfeD family protein [Bacillota bacterium]
MKLGAGPEPLLVAGFGPGRPRSLRTAIAVAAGLTLLIATMTTALLAALTPVPAWAEENAAPAAGGEQRPRVRVAHVEGLITAGTAAFVDDAIAAAAEAGDDALLIVLDTPGGLVDATIEIIQAMAAAPLPVIVYVGPSGAIAASAGSFILVAGHVAAMAPGTTTGAAMPVAIDPTGQGPPAAADEKTIRFLAGHLRSLARERGRPVDIVERFVTENLTLDATEALERGVIDVIAASPEQLLEQIDGRAVRLGEREHVLRTAGAERVDAQMSASQRFKHLVSNPQLAFLLLIGGAYALYFGLASPGTLIPETLGAVLVLLGLYGLGLFGTNLAGLLLIGLGLVFLVLEWFAPTHGALTAAGAVSILLGALLLPAEPLLPDAWFSGFRATAIGLAIGAGLLSALTTGAILRSRRKVQPYPTGGVAPRGRVVETLSPTGRVRVGGELWWARSADGSTVTAGSEIEVVGREGLTLIVRAVERERATAGPATPAGEPAPGPRSPSAESTGKGDRE